MILKLISNWIYSIFKPDTSDKKYGLFIYVDIVDAQSVKNTDTADEKGYDAGKKVSGIKRHIVVGTNGLPHAVVVTTANVTDREGAFASLFIA